MSNTRPASNPKLLTNHPNRNLLASTSANEALTWRLGAPSLTPNKEIGPFCLEGVLRDLWANTLKHQRSGMDVFVCPLRYVGWVFFMSSQRFGMGVFFNVYWEAHRL